MPITLFPVPAVPGKPQAGHMAEALLKTYPCAPLKAPTSPTRAVKMPRTIVASPPVQLQYAGKQRGAGCIDQPSHMAWLSQSALEIDSGHRRCCGGRGCRHKNWAFFSPTSSTFCFVRIQGDCCTLFDPGGDTATEERRHLSLCGELRTPHLVF